MIKNQWPSQSTKNDVCPSFLVSRSSNLQLSDRLKVRRKLRNAGVIADLNKFERRPIETYDVSHPRRICCVFFVRQFIFVIDRRSTLTSDFDGNTAKSFSTTTIK